MDESGIDMGYDLASLLTNDFNIDQRIFDGMTTTQPHQDFMFYELKSKAVPVTESAVCDFSLHLWTMRKPERLSEILSCGKITTDMTYTYRYNKSVSVHPSLELRKPLHVTQYTGSDYETNPTRSVTGRGYDLQDFNTEFKNVLKLLDW
ncbi:unnamed protein product [Euphydryas editha]|uniref:Uncharacterized protein n=1 Tax=Euphydryas editha TaxID=104508 RepID=A0AAU9UJI5_EUPED|nr:unnamed protein product [Euphydryas editha]